MNLVARLYTTSTSNICVALIDLNGEVTKVGKPAIFRGVSLDASGELLLVTEVSRPYSYLMPYYNFGQRSSVWNLKGELLERVVDLPPIHKLYGALRKSHIK